MYIYIYIYILESSAALRAALIRRNIHIGGGQEARANAPYMNRIALFLVPLRVLFVVVECRSVSMQASLAHCAHPWVPGLSTNAQKQISLHFGSIFEPDSASAIIEKQRFPCLREVAVDAHVLRVWRMAGESTKHRCPEDRKWVWYCK